MKSQMPMEMEDARRLRQIAHHRPIHSAVVMDATDPPGVTDNLAAAMSSWSTGTIAFAVATIVVVLVGVVVIYVPRPR